MSLTEVQIGRIVDREISNDWLAFAQQINETNYSDKLKTSLIKGIAKAIAAAIEASKDD